MKTKKELMKLKENLQKILDERGLKASELSRISGIPKQRISDWLAGASVRNIEQLRLVAKTLETSIDELMFGDKIPLKEIKSTDPFAEPQEFKITVQRVRR